MKQHIESLYLTYFNEFLTVERFANYYGFDYLKAYRIVNLGRRLNHRRSKNA